MIKKFTNKNGFTLIEILVSIVLLTVVISLFLTIFPQMGNMNNLTGDNLDAANVGKELLVKMKNRTYSEATSGTRLPITLTHNINKLTDPITLTGIYYSNEKSIKVNISLWSAADVSGTVQSLHKIKIDVLNSQDKILTSTYGYIKE